MEMTMAGQTSQTHGKHAARGRATTAHARKHTARQHAPKQKAEPSPAVDPEEPAELTTQAETALDPWDVREPDRDSSFEREAGELRDVERDAESDHSRDDSDIEHSHE